MKKYMIYDIENMQPIKISSTANQSDNEETKGYIPGGVLRGAYIAKYLCKNGVKDINTGKHKNKLLKGDIKFHNAYPIFNNNESSYPAPKCIYVNEDEKPNMLGIRRIECGYKQGMKKYKDVEFVHFNCDKLEKVSVNKREFIHINLRENEDKTHIFRYDAIEKGNRFKGVVEFSGENIDENIDEFKRLLNEEVGFYVGGSRSSGYGLCRVVNTEESDENPYIEEFYEDGIEDYFENQENEMYIYALSDILYSDSKGIYKSYIDCSVLEENLGIENVELLDSFVETEIFTGFNNKWGYRLPLISGIKAGSVLRYRYDGEIDWERAEEFITKGIGRRRIDGFGNFIILTRMDFSTIYTKTDSKKYKGNLVDINERDKAQMQIIINRLDLNVNNRKITKEILRLENIIRGELNNNQWGRLYRLMQIIEYMPVDDGIKKIKDYFNHIYNKKENRDITDKFKNLYIDNKSVDEYIKDYILNNNNKRISIGEISSNIKEKEIYRLNIKCLKELFKIKMKSSSKEEQ